MEKIKVTRKTTESEMNVVLDFAPLKKDYRKYIKTPIPFLNHMIEHIAWRGEVNIDVDLKLDEFVLTHVICEDLGIALGKAAKEYKIKQVAVAGGVSANNGLRNAFREHAEKYGWRIFIPKFSYTTDNAAMIAITGYFKYQDKDFCSIDAPAYSRVTLK